MALPTIFPMGYVTRCGFKYLLFSTLLGGSTLTNMFQLDWNYQQLGGFCRKQKSCQCLFWCVFFSKKNRKKSLPKQFEICSGQITSAPNKPPVEISNEMLVVKCSKGIPPQNALKIFVFLNWSHLPSWYRMIYKISTILPQFCYIGSDPSDFVFLQDNVWYWIHGLLEMALQNGLST